MNYKFNKGDRVQWAAAAAYDQTFMTIERRYQYKGKALYTLTFVSGTVKSIEEEQLKKYEYGKGN